ncbi:MAG: cation transporter [Euryarchaeota archaeon]|nr:cation transporter [Euryarchaeota archaeon]
MLKPADEREKASMVGVAGNLCLAALKGGAGIYSGSAALVAHAIDSLTDVLLSAVALVGIRVSNKPADSTHPHGHHDAEAIAGLVASLFLVFVVVEFMIGAAARVLNPPERIGGVAIAAVVLNLAGKYALSSYTAGVARRTRSPALEASAANYRGDVYTSLAVLAGVLAGWAGFGLLDSLVGVGIALVVLRIAGEMCWKNVRYLMGTVPSQEMVKRIESVSLATPGVVHVHRIKLHAMGAYCKVDLHVCVDENLELKEAHRIAHEVENNISKSMPEVSSVTVHVEPFDRHHRENH